jgi:hypothetical protein
MRRVVLAVVVCGLVLVAGLIAYRVVACRLASSGRITAKQAELRYQQCQPRHWRSLLLRP